MTDLAEHAVEDGPRLLLDRAADLAEPERAQRAAVALALADLAPDLRDPHLRHLALVLLLAADPALRLLLGDRLRGGGGSGRLFGHRLDDLVACCCFGL